jgi:hypothetical protein
VGEAWCAGLWLCLVLSVSRPPPPASLPALPLYYLVVCLPRTPKTRHDNDAMAMGRVKRTGMEGGKEWGSSRGPVASPFLHY